MSASTCALTCRSHSTTARPMVSRGSVHCCCAVHCKHLAEHMCTAHAYCAHGHSGLSLELASRVYGVLSTS